MRHVLRFALVLGVVALLATPAWAQPRPGGGGFTSPLMLLGQDSVKTELKVTEDQGKKVADLQAKQRDLFQGFQGLSEEERRKKSEEIRKSNDKALAEILKPEQLKRIKEITLQQRGSRAFSDAEIQTALKITDDQKSKITAIQEDADKLRRELFQGGFNEETRKKMEELNKSTNEKVTKLLTADQQKAYKDMLGEPFKGEIRFGPRPGGAGGAGGATTPGRPGGGAGQPGQPGGNRRPGQPRPNPNP